MTAKETLRSFIYRETHSIEAREQLLDALDELANPKCTFTDQTIRTGPYTGEIQYDSRLVLGNQVFSETQRVSRHFSERDPKGITEHIERMMKTRMGHAIMDFLWPEDEDA